MSSKKSTNNRMLSDWFSAALQISRKMQIAFFNRFGHRVLIAGMLGLMQSCAFVSHAVDPDVSACIDEQGKAHLMVQNVETVRGSAHTPFDYGNKSVSRIAYEVVVPLAVGRWTEADIEVFAAKFRQDQTRGSVSISKDELVFELYVAARDLPNYSLVPIKGVASGRGEAYLRTAPQCGAGN